MWSTFAIFSLDISLTPISTVRPETRYEPTNSRLIALEIKRLFVYHCDTDPPLSRFADTDLTKIIRKSCIPDAAC